MRLLILSIILVVLHSTDVAAANTPEPTHQEVIEALELLLSKADRKARVADPEGAGGGSGAGNPPPSDRKGDVRRAIRNGVNKVKARVKKIRAGSGALPPRWSFPEDYAVPEPPEEIDPNMSDAGETIRAIYCEAFPELEELESFCPGELATV